MSRSRISGWLTDIFPPFLPVGLLYCYGYIFANLYYRNPECLLHQIELNSLA